MGEKYKAKTVDGISYETRKDIINTLFDAAREYAAKFIANESNREKQKHRKVFSILIKHLTNYDASMKIENLPASIDLSRCSLSFKKIIDWYCDEPTPYEIKMDEIKKFMQNRIDNLRTKYSNSIYCDIPFTNILNSCYRELQEMHTQINLRVNDKGPTIDDSLLWLIKNSKILIKEYRKSSRCYQPNSGEIEDLLFELKGLESSILRNGVITNSSKQK